MLPFPFAGLAGHVIVAIRQQTSTPSAFGHKYGSKNGVGSGYAQALSPVDP
jgi:hypothetical protein